MLRLAAWMYPLLPLGHTGTAARGIAAAAAARCPAITHGYNDSEEMDVSEAALQEEAAAARRATEQVRVLPAGGCRRGAPALLPQRVPLSLASPTLAAPEPHDLPPLPCLLPRLQCGSTSEHDMARAIAHDSREAAAVRARAGGRRQRRRHGRACRSPRRMQPPTLNAPQPCRSCLPTPWPLQARCGPPRYPPPTVPPPLRW